MVIRAPYPWQIEDTECFELQAPFDMTFEVSVALPGGYAKGKNRFAALLVLDANLAFPIAVATARTQAALRSIEEIAVVGISTPRREGEPLMNLQRLCYLTPGAPPISEAFEKAMVQAMAEPMRLKGWGLKDCFGGAGAFLDFLGAVVVPTLVDRYRIDGADLGLFGHSAAGAFVSFALLGNTALFSRYVAGTFGTVWYRDLADREAAFAAGFTGRRVRVFHGVGGGELTDPALGAGAQEGLALIQRLDALSLPGLQISTRVFEGENHGSVIPHVIATGIRTLYGAGGD